jgi:hypothetical protein
MAMAAKAIMVVLLCFFIDCQLLKVEQVVVPFRDASLTIGFCHIVAWAAPKVNSLRKKVFFCLGLTFHRGFARPLLVRL